MIEYPKIQTVFKRDPATHHKTLLDGQFSEPEFEYLSGNEWVFTEKVDGTNIRVISAPPGPLIFRGRTGAASIPGPLSQRLAERFENSLLAETFPEGICLYGEGYGPRLQKGGGNYRPDMDFVLFDIRIGEFWLRREAVEAIAGTFGLDIVPIIGRGPLAEMIAMARAGIKSHWGDFAAEGIVARPAVELQCRAGRRIITKIKSKDFAP